MSAKRSKASAKAVKAQPKEEVKLSKKKSAKGKVNEATMVKPLPVPQPKAENEVEREVEQIVPKSAKKSKKGSQKASNVSVAKSVEKEPVEAAAEKEEENEEKKGQEMQPKKKRSKTSKKQATETSTNGATPEKTDKGSKRKHDDGDDDTSMPAKKVAVEDAGDKVYVGNLNWELKEDELKELFVSNGFTVLSVAIPLNKITSKSKGFGFVQLSSAEEAKKAVTKFNEMEFNERTLRVNVYEKPEPRTVEHTEPEPSCVLFVKGLSETTTDENVSTHFAKQSPVKVVVPKDKATGKMIGIAYVTFEDVSGAEAAIAALNNTALNGSTITLEFSRPYKSKASRASERARGRGRGRGRGGRGRGN